VPRIIDFGLSKASARPTEPADEAMLTMFGQLMGTPGYMSPEQADPNIQDIDTRTDVYSLGVILYVLLAGLQPFETASGYGAVGGVRDRVGSPLCDVIGFQQHRNGV
jgi:serine/threonine protein kinase